MNETNRIENTTSPIAGAHIQKEQENQVKKKKCRGNRRRQRYRRQLYNQGLDSATVEKRIQEQFHSQVQQRQQQQQRDKLIFEKSDRQNIEVSIPLDRVGFFFNSFVDIRTTNYLLFRLQSHKYRLLMMTIVWKWE